MAVIAVTRRLPGPALERLGERHTVELWPGDDAPSPEELRRLVADAEGLLCLLTDRVDQALLDAAPRLRAIANFAVGYDNIDLPAVARRDIPVGVTPGVLTEATADLAMTLLLAVARRVPAAAAAVRAGGYRTGGPADWLGLELAGATLLIVGAGRIGDAVARRAEAFGMEILAAGRDADLPALFAQADAVTVHVPLTEQSRGLVGEAALRAMRPRAILVNTSRGAVVDQTALCRALHEGWIAGAGLDVTDPEPLTPGDPLLGAPNLLILPHIGSATHAARERMASMAVDNLLAALDGQAMPHPAPQAAAMA
ncbi:MAG: D-glycerate dehydrogenase [Acidimicrobiales bacterium]